MTKGPHYHHTTWSMTMPETFRITCPSPQAASVLAAYLDSEECIATWHVCSTTRKPTVLTVATWATVDHALRFCNAGLGA